jgi:hypothetical protein
MFCFLKLEKFRELPLTFSSVGQDIILYAKATKTYKSATEKIGGNFCA